MKVPIKTNVDDSQLEGKTRNFDEGAGGPGMGMGDVHVPAPVNSEPKGKKKKKGKKSKQLKSQKRAMNYRGDPNFKSASGDGLRMSLPLPFSENMSLGEPWIQYIPKPGKWTSQQYGDIEITNARNKEFVDNFNAGVYQNRIPIDAEHQSKLSGALGWIEKMRQNADGSVSAFVEWTGRGKDMLAKKAFRYFSPEWYDAWREPASGKVFSNIAIGGALTTRPFFKEGSLEPVIASESGFDTMTLKQESRKMPKDEGTGTVDAKSFAELASRVETLMSESVTIQAQAKKFAEERDEAQAEAKKFAERVAAMEIENTRRILTEVARQFEGETAKHVALMESLTEDQLKSYVEMQTSLTEQVKTAALSKPIGVADRGVVGGNAVEQVRLKAESSIQASEKTKSAINRAVANAWDDESYSAYLRETGQA